MINQSAQYQGLLADVKEIINSVLLSNLADISFSRLSVSLYEDEEKKRNNILVGFLPLFEQPKPFILFIQSLHLIVLAFLFIQLHLLAEQGAKEAINCTLLPSSSILWSHKIL